MALTVGTNGNNVEETMLVGTQVNAEDINTRVNAGRLTIRLRSLKGLLTIAIRKFSIWYLDGRSSAENTIYAWVRLLPG